MVYKYISSN